MQTERLSRRERQIMEVLIRESEGTIAQIQNQIEDAPSVNAVRTLVQILEEKGHLTREKRGREFVYFPKINRKEEGTAALQKVLETFFKGSVSEALSAHFSGDAKDISAEEVERLSQLIEQARKNEKGEA